MTTETLTLTEFLLARIAEDETVARNALEQSAPGRWNANDYFDESGISVWSSEEGGTVTSETGDEAPMWHIVRFDPTRALAECEAKRRIVLDAQDRERGAALAPAMDEMTAEARLMAANIYDDVMRHLASVYVDHPDFRDDWRP